MNPSAIFIVALIALTAVGLFAWAWFAMAQVEQQLRLFGGFEQRHFEIGPQASNESGGARWATPG